MGALDIFALIVIGILVALVIWLVVLFGSLPGDIARKRAHPQTDAITALGWIGVITLGAGWFIALVWAYYKPPPRDEQYQTLARRVEELEHRLQAVKPPASPPATEADKA